MESETLTTRLLESSRISPGFSSQFSLFTWLPIRSGLLCPIHWLAAVHPLCRQSGWIGVRTDSLRHVARIDAGMPHPFHVGTDRAVQGMNRNTCALAVGLA